MGHVRESDHWKPLIAVVCDQGCFHLETANAELAVDVAKWHELRGPRGHEITIRKADGVDLVFPAGGRTDFGAFCRQGCFTVRTANGQTAQNIAWKHRNDTGGEHVPATWRPMAAVKPGVTA